MTFPMLNSYANFVLKKPQDDQHCYMISLHGDELGFVNKKTVTTVVSEQNDNEK